MIPLLLVAGGVVALVAGIAILRSFGPRFRVGRLLASTPTVSIEAARALAEAGERRYVRVSGRVDAEDEFEDPDHRPLVFRRTRLMRRGDRGRGWVAFEDTHQHVRFELREGLTAIEIDPEPLADGLVVVPRISEGVAGELGERAPAGLDPDTPVRVVIEQVSSVEHAIVLGVPIAAGASPRMTAGLGRPLVLTTLEPPEAMRLLTDGAGGRLRLAAALFGLGAVFGLAGLLGLAIEALP